MDTLTFASNLVRDLAWPITALLVLFLLSRNGFHFSRFIKSIRLGDAEVVFREQWADAREDAAQVKTEAGMPASQTIEVTDKILRLAEIDSGVAIVEVWKALEAALISLIQHNGLIRFTTPARFMKQLAKLGKISESELTLFRKLTEIRNESVHGYAGRAPTIAEVVEFRDFVELLMNKLQKIREEPEYIDVPRG